MNKKLQLNTNLSSLVSLICLLIIFILPIAAQEDVNSKNDKLLPPSAEKFVEEDAIASPWIVGDCPDDDLYKITDCHRIGGKSYEFRHTSIYNNDGSLWYVYSNHSYEPDYFRRNKTMDFLPFAGYGDFGRTAILRMVGESNSWYEVIVNEKTKATKFILKSDSRWEKKTWDFWLAKIEFYTVGESDKTKIYNKPNEDI